ncbi:MAG: cysteine synthase [Thermoprotei archaeon]|nr:MAG: cysteine synthase [Thermoprotei archaeon]
MTNECLKVFHSTLDLATGLWPTPLVRLNSLSSKEVEVWAKLEFFNPFSHSIKDRTVWNMITKARERGILRGRLYEATSGNVGIAMACLANILGLKFRAYLPAPTLDSTLTLLKLLGAEVIVTNYSTIDRRMINYVSELAKREGAVNLNQFDNDDNFEVHFNHTAKELDEQLRAVNRAPPRGIFAGVGTSGHIAALSKYFKSKYGSSVKIYGIIPSGDCSIPGIKRLETGPKWFFEVEVDGVEEVSFREAIEGCAYIARHEGLLIGLSSGAVTSAFIRRSKDLSPGTYVLIYPDDAFKYISYLKEYLGG